MKGTLHLEVCREADRASAFFTCVLLVICQKCFVTDFVNDMACQPVCQGARGPVSQALRVPRWLVSQGTKVLWSVSQGARVLVSQGPGSWQSVSQGARVLAVACQPGGRDPGKLSVSKV